MDKQTQNLLAALRTRDKLRAALAESDRTLNDALRVWSDRRPGSRGGIATEAGARLILSQAGLL